MKRYSFYSTFVLMIFGLNLGLVSCTSKTEAVESTTFLCEKQENQWVTIVQRGNYVSKPLFIWSTEEFGDKFTPETRCQEVTSRFNQFVADNGGLLQNLALKAGTLNEKTVICVTEKQGEECNDDNLLVTLKQTNQGNSSQIIKNIQEFAKSPENSNPIVENGQPSDNIFLLEDFVDTKLKAGHVVPSNKNKPPEGGL